MKSAVRVAGLIDYDFEVAQIRREREDRRVHASDSRGEVVRYDRPGKWYAEPFEGERIAVKVSLAAEVAVFMEKHGHDAVIHLGLPGGAVFDRLVAQKRARR